MVRHVCNALRRRPNCWPIRCLECDTPLTHLQPTQLHYCVTIYDCVAFIQWIVHVTLIQLSQPLIIEALGQVKGLKVAWGKFKCGKHLVLSPRCTIVQISRSYAKYSSDAMGFVGQEVCLRWQLAYDTFSSRHISDHFTAAGSSDRYWLLGLACVSLYTETSISQVILNLTLTEVQVLWKDRKWGKMVNLVVSFCELQ